LDRLNRTADVERYLSRLENQMPFSQRLTQIAADYELKRDHPEQAIQIARAAVMKRPQDAHAHLWLARLLLANKQRAEAETEFVKTLELAPNDIRAWNGLFTYYVRTGSLERAKQILDELRDKANFGTTDPSFVLAQAYEMLGDWKNAEGQYEKAAAKAPNRADVYVRLATVHLRSDPKKAEQSLRTALELERGSATARRMLAALLASRGDEKQLEEAENLLQHVSPGMEGVPVEDRRLNALLLAHYGDAEQGVRAAEMLEEVVAKPEQDAPGDRLILARIYESQARSSPNPKEAEAKRAAAERHLLAVASRSGALPAHLVAFIEFFLNRGRPDEAEHWLKKLESLIESQACSEPSSIAQLIELRIRHGSLDQSQKWLERLSAVDTDPVRPVALQAAWLTAKGRSAEIEALVEPVASKILATADNEVERGRRARLIGDLYMATRMPDRAERWYRTAVSHDAAQYPAEVRALVLNGQVNEAIQLCRDQMRPGSTGNPAVVLASALMEANESDHLETADAFLDSVLTAQPADVKLRYTVATLRAVQGRYDEAIQFYRQVLESEPKNVAVLNNLAMMLAENAEGRAESLELIDRAITIAGQQPGLLDTKGAILLYHGEARQAVILLEAAAREAGTDARHRFHLAAAYRGVGDAMRAKEQLQAALAQQLEKQVLTPTDRRMLSELKAALIN
jgi:tetratricopeptide (TPR) repeat protein